MTSIIVPINIGFHYMDNWKIYETKCDALLGELLVYEHPGYPGCYGFEGYLELGDNFINLLNNDLVIRKYTFGDPQIACFFEEKQLRNVPASDAVYLCEELPKLIHKHALVHPAGDVMLVI